MIYRKEESVIFRSMENSDIKKFPKAFTAQNWDKPEELFECYFNRQEHLDLNVVVAEVMGDVAGYVTLFPNATSGPFAGKDIPEIADLNVLIKYQKQGIGNMLMDNVEGIAKETSKLASLAVGLHNGYGSAQRMYVKRGYIPDGSGVWYMSNQLEQYANCVNDDDLILYLLKQL